MPVQYLGDGNPSGTVVGRTGSPLSLYEGSTPGAQPAVITSVTTTGVSSTTNAYGFTTAAQGDAVVASLNAVIAALITVGAIAAA